MVERLVAALGQRTNTHLKTISLKNSSKVTDKHMDDLGHLIGPDGPRRGCCGGRSGITEVILDGTDVSREKAAWLKRNIDMRRILDCDPRLDIVDWSDSDVGDHDIEQLADIVNRKGCVVTEIILAHNPGITDCTPLHGVVHRVVHGAVRWGRA